MSNPTVGQDDVGVEDLTRGWVYATRADCCSHIVVQPTNEVVANILGVFFHVNTALGVLIFDHDRVDQAYLFKGFVPVINTSLDPSAIANGRSVLNVEPNGLFWRAELKARITFLQFPAIDETNASVVILVSAQIGERCREVTYSLISFSGLVPCCHAGDFTK